MRSHIYFPMCLLFSGPFLSLHFSNHHRNIVMSGNMFVLANVRVRALCLLASWALCLAKLGHLHGDISLKLGTKSWFRSDPKNSFVLCPWVSLTFLKNSGECVFSLPQGKNLFQCNFYPYCAHDAQLMS